MRFQKQTAFGEQGNCFATCVAILCNMDLSDVPNFCAVTSEYAWFHHYCAWLRDVAKRTQRSWSYKIYQEGHGDRPKGWTLLEYLKHNCGFEKPEEAIYIACGLAARGHQHAVLYKGDQLLWDPYPEGEGIAAVEEIYVIDVPGEVR